MTLLAPAPSRRDARSSVPKWETVLAIDSDPWACKTYAANFPGVRVECGKVSDWIDRLPHADLILGGPPCQPYSLAGEGEGAADDRDCIPDFVAAVLKVRPTMFLMENVPGLLARKHIKHLSDAVGRLDREGYEIQVKELDAVAFGVPQFRNRVWVWGISKVQIYAQGIWFRWPQPTHAWPPPEPSMWGGDPEPAVTVGQALGRPVHLRRLRGKGMFSRSGPRRDHPPTEPCPTIGTTFALGGSGGLLVIDYDHGVAFDDQPSPTIKAGGNRDRSGKQGGGCPPKLASTRRRMTPGECARIQSMPDDFIWPAGIPKTEKYRIVGNGWACGMAAHLARGFAAGLYRRTVIDLFCGGGLGACGWHGRYWAYDAGKAGAE